MVFSEHATIKEKLAILSDAAKYDVACTSSGVERAGRPGELGNSAAAGICHTFGADGRCISLLKILMTNECIYNCKYCINRSSNDVPRATFTPEEICTLTVEFYRRNYIEGLFLSSGVIGSPNHTMELMMQVLRDLRVKYHFNGYIHCKAIPGASPELVEECGWFADRMSINLELPTADGLRELAPNKTRKAILTPMRQIQAGMAESRELLGMSGGNRSAYYFTQQRVGRDTPGLEVDSSVSKMLSGKAEQMRIDNPGFGISGEPKGLVKDMASRGFALTRLGSRDISRGFVPAGQSTQMIIGATGETDYQIMSVTEALYRNFDLKRVFFSAFINVNGDSNLPAPAGGPPLKREHRLYQADFLLRYYGFEASDLLSEKHPFFNPYLDPKCDWALAHLELFPVEVTRADYDTLLKVPGIGAKSARRIIAARRQGKIDFSTLKTAGVVLKRAVYFITCYGRMLNTSYKVDEDYITRMLLSDSRDIMADYGSGVTYKQLNFTDIWNEFDARNNEYKTKDNGYRTRNDEYRPKNNAGLQMCE